MLFRLNSVFESKSFIEEFRGHYCGKSRFENFLDESLLNHKPFTFAKFNNFLQLGQGTEEIKDTNQLIQSLEEEVKELPFVRRSNDLYTFAQSCDVVNLCSGEDNPSNTSQFPLLTGFRTFLLSSVLPWLKDLTGIPLCENKVDLTSSIYKHGNYLLCHDDELEGRRIAFIWYLVPDEWDRENNGGELQLFESEPVDDNKDSVNAGKFMPTAISTTLPPKRNTFTFFEVSPRSFHQVAEVLGHSKRVSLHGWFHGPSLWTVSNNTVQSIEKISPVHIEEELVYQWINPVYFNPQQVNKIRRRFCRSSEIQLTNFIKVDKWKELVQCLDGIPANNWFHCGPANRRNYDCLSVSEDIDKCTPDLCRQIVRLFKSEAMLVILSDLTGIQLHPCGLISESGKTGVDEDIASKAVELAPESKRMRTDNHLNNLTTTDDDCPTYLTEPCLRKFHKGSYTLLSDVDMLNQGWRVECILYIHGYCGSGHGGDYDLVCQDSKIEDCSRINSRSAWNSSWGGQMVYVTDGETDELLTVTPSDNALTLVYVDSCTTSFLKYIKKTAGESSVEKLSDEEGNLDNLPSVVEPSHLSENHIDKESVRFYDLFVKYFESRSDLEEDVNSQNCALGEDDDVISNNSADDDGSSLSPSEDDDDDDDDDEEEEEKGEQEEVDLT